MDFDLAIIGGGPGGYTCAIRAAQLGLKVALVEKRSTLGGTCLNIGCIPSKALLESSEHFYGATHKLSKHGVDFSSVTLNLSQMMKRKEDIVKELTSGVKFLMNKNKIQVFNGFASFKNINELEIVGDEGSKKSLSSKNFVIATGSEPTQLPGLDYDEKNIVSSTGALSLSSVPEKLLIVGAGYIGLELGSVWQRLGSQVTVVEYGTRIAATMDERMSKELLKSLKKQGMNFVFNSAVRSGKVENQKVKVQIEDLSAQKTDEHIYDVVLVSAGRRPFVAGLGLKNVNVETNSHGFLEVDAKYNVSGSENIFAIGDVIPGPMLAHKAEEEGVAVAENLAGQAGHVNYATVPSVIYTHPEVASVGKTEQELKAQGIAYNVGRFPFSANGRAKALGDTEGLVQILAHKETDELLGAHIIGPRASDLIAEAVMVMEFGGSSEDLARSFHGHPTLSEVVREAALDVEKRARQM